MGPVLSSLAPKVALSGHTAVPSAGSLTCSVMQPRLSVPNLRGKRGFSPCRARPQRGTERKPALAGHRLGCDHASDDHFRVMLRETEAGEFCRLREPGFRPGPARGNTAVCRRDGRARASSPTRQAAEVRPSRPPPLRAAGPACDVGVTRPSLRRLLLVAPGLQQGSPSERWSPLGPKATCRPRFLLVSGPCLLDFLL